MKATTLSETRRGQVFVYLRRAHVRMLVIVASLILAAFGIAATTSAQTHQDWSYNLGMYEVNVRQYSPESTFDAFATHLDRLQELGAGILWFMPIHPIGQQNRLGSLGSYYSVRDYLGVNPEFGTLDEFKQVVQAAHDRGMYVIMDWVANHTAWDNPLTVQHPEWYVTDSGGNFIPPPGTNWSDVIELDYTEQGLRDYMIDAMKYWVEEVGVDGFRCDAVSFVPRDFWQQAIAELKSVRSDLLFLAEGDGPEWHNVGFDMTYGWDLYGFGGGVLKRIADGVDTASNFAVYVDGEKVTYSDGEYRMYFTSNHDENSWHGTTAELFGDAAEVFSVLTATFNGMPLIYSGQEAGLDKRLLFFDKDQIVWRSHENAELYSTLLRLKKGNQALWNGRSGATSERVLTTDNGNVYAFLRQHAEDRLLVVVNLSDQPRDIGLFGSRFEGSYRNVFADTLAIVNSATTISLSPWGYGVFEDASVNTGLADFDLHEAVVLYPNYPNPFSDRTTVAFSLSGPSEVRLEIFDVAGRRVRTAGAGMRAAGRHEVVVQRDGLPAGVYYLRLQIGDATLTGRIVIIP